MDDHFFHMGGDSVKSMRLVSQLHKEGYTLTVDQIFHHPTLGEMADMAEQSSDPLGDVKPFQLIPTGKHADLMNEAARQCQCQIADITDIYPATPVQEGLMAASTDGTGAYVSNLAWTVPSHIDVARLQQALKAVIETSDILRTRLFHTEDGLMQCIQGPAEPVPITRSDQSPLDLAAHLSKHQSPMGLGQRLIAFNIIEGSSDRYLTMTAHHSVYDGWMAPQMFHNIEAAYFGEALVPSTPFRRFVAHIQSGNEKASEAYWKRAMEGANIPDFPEYPRADYQARTSARVTYCMRPAETPRGVTLASVIRAAWALLLGKHTGSQDVVFGVTMTGRGASMPGIESVDGPCINTTPTRLWFEPSETVSSYLERVHQEGMDAVPHEQLGLQHIRKLSVDCAACCEMRTTLVVQTGNIVAGKRLGLEEVSLDGRQIHNQAINLQCILGEDDIVFDVNYDENVLSERQMLRILQQLEHFIYQMTTAETSTILRDLSGASPSDVDEIRHWNSYMPPERNILMHDLIARKVAATPEKTAIDAWDGCFTYTQFDLAATKLAHHLVNHWRVVPDEVVPLYFEKSKWTAVAMYGILKAGAAYAFIGLQEPPARIRSMLQTTRARLAISSSAQSKALVPYIPDVVTLSEDSMKALPGTSTPVWTDVTPNNAAYILFTSGYGPSRQRNNRWRSVH